MLLFLSGPLITMSLALLLDEVEEGYLYGD